MRREIIASNDDSDLRPNNKLIDIHMTQTSKYCENVFNDNSMNE